MTFKPLSLSTVLKRICSICEDLICSVGLDFGFEEKTGVGLRIMGKGSSRTQETTIHPSRIVSFLIYLIMSQANNKDKKSGYEQSILLCLWWCKFSLWCFSSCLWRWRICYHLAAHHQRYSLQSLHICWGHVTWGRIAYPRVKVISHLSPCRPTASLHWAHTASLSF